MNEIFLRPLTVGELLDKAFRIYRSRFATLIGIVAVVLIPESIIRLFAIFYLDATAGSLVILFIQIFIRFFAELALLTLLSHEYLGKTISFGESYSRGIKHYGSALWATSLMLLAMLAPAVFVIMCSVVSGGLSMLLLIPWLPLVFYLSTRWAVNTCAIVMENAGALEGLRRSWGLTKDYFWRVLGTSVAASLLTFLITSLPTYIFSYLFMLADLPMNTIQMINLAIEQAGQMIATPFALAVTVLIYYDLRVRKEGFDLEVLAGDSNTPIVVPD